MDQIGERLNEQILRLILEGDVSAREMVNAEVLNMIDNVLVEEDRQACLLFMNNQLRELMAMAPASVKVAKQAVPDLLKLLRNIEPNAEVEQGHNPSHN